MNSIRTKTTLLTICAIVVAVAVATLFGVVAIRNMGNENSDQMLLLLCEIGEKNLDSYFESVEQSVRTVSTLVQEDLNDLPRDQLGAHIDRARAIFSRVAYQAHGVLTYYYRIDPSVSRTEKGFWYVNLGDEGFKEHEVTDITLYDTMDTTSLVWFTVPKATGEAIWLPPYITDNLDVRVISYNVPIYWDGRFIGVIGIEIDYSTMAKEVDHIKLYDNGYAFINDAQGNIVYHPRMDVTVMDAQPKVPEGLLSDSSFIRYTYDGVEKQAVWLPMSNGMRLNVTVPIAEINRGWRELFWQVLVASAIVLILVSIITMRFTGHITKPLKDLKEAAEQVNAGNYDVALNYAGNDEIGVLTRTFSRLISYLKGYIGDLNDLAYADALTSVRNKGAFDIFVRELQTRLNASEEPIEFAVGYFDCDDLKRINDQHGHDKGDIYLKSASRLICQVFKHSPVFRVGGDEFAVILEADDYRNRRELLQMFEERCEETLAASQEPWEYVSVARGVAVYDPEADKTVADVVRRADKLMYEDKRKRKNE